MHKSATFLEPESNPRPQLEPVVGIVSFNRRRVSNKKKKFGPFNIFIGEVGSFVDDEFDEPRGFLGK